jgi:serine/threonine protein kinase/tetratricopeptide (TPR) repeat protein
MALTAGTKLGRYEIRSKLGQGGMGEVYLAEDTQLHRKVALKVLPAEVSSNQDRMRRFVQEARAAAVLNHPNIAHVYEIGEADGRHFIAMEFVDGMTLRDKIHGDPAELRKLLRFLQHTAEGLAKAHAAGIVHRDLKPDNIMITNDGHPKILDFGLAKLIEQRPPPTSAEGSSEVATAVMPQRSIPGTVMGTVGYMSPEQAQAKPVDQRSDIFSFGCILFEATTGRRPFAGDSIIDTLHKIIYEPAPAITELNPSAPPELQRIIRKCLMKEPEKRYQTIRDAANDLEELLEEMKGVSDIERSVTPSASATTSGAIKSTDDEIWAESTASVTQQPASSAEYIVSGMRQHKLAVAIAVIVLMIGYVGLATYLQTRNTEVAIGSIAVLPFANASNDPNTEYLSDGISEALINSLTELRQLRVVARSTAFRYKGKDVDPTAVGRELNVRAVLMGRVRQIGDTLNVQVDLVDATTGGQLWGQEYERKVSDVLSVKQAIVREVTEKLRLRLTGEDQQQLVRSDTTNAEAYQSYLRGRFYWNKRTADGLKKAIEEFQQAIDYDPNYALGYVGLADCYVLLEEYAGIPSSETLPKARAAADRALQIDNSLAEGHASSAFIYQKLWRWAEAEEEYKRAISLKPNYPTAHHWFSIYFRTKMQIDDAMREIKRAQELDPLSSVFSVNVAEVYLFKNDINAAIGQSQRVIELDAGFPYAHDVLGVAYLKQRRYEEATAEFQKAVELSGRASQILSHLGYCYAVTGRRAEALAILKELEEKYASRDSIGQYVADVYAGLGDKDQAFAWLERDFQQHSGRLPDMTWKFGLEDLRSDPRYADLVRRMGLKP